jgi:hypothetical protein
LKEFNKIALFTILLFILLPHRSVAQDTLPPPKHDRKTFTADPMKATMLAVALPGLGQIYNRKYWKIPFVYAGFGGVAYAISFNSTYYNKFLKAYQDFTDDIKATDSYIELIKNADPETYDPVLHPTTYNPSNAAWYKERMLRQVDYFKKYRDLSYIGVAAWYLITIIDANVDASLSNYDINDNLAIKLEPFCMPDPVQQGMGMQLRLRATF